MLTMRPSRLIVAILIIMSSFVVRVGRSAEPELRSLAIVPEVASIDEGSTASFVVIGTYANGQRTLITNKVTWSSSNRNVAKVANNGTVSGITHGKATINAAIKSTSGKIRAEATLTVRPLLTSLSLDPQSTTFLPGQSCSFKLRGVYSEGTVALLSDRAKWSVEGDGSAATIDASGTATAVREGTAMIVAAVGNLRAMARMRIGKTPAPLEARLPATARSPKPVPSSSARSRPAFVTSVSIEPMSRSLPERQTQQLTATGHYSDGTARDITRDAVWASSDVEVARVGTDGTVYGVRFGTATIAGTLETFSGVSMLTVTPIVVRLVLQPEALTIKHRATGQLSALAIWSNDATSDVTDRATWTSSDENVASVSSGSIQGIAPGSATITATMDDFRASAAITIEPLLQSIAIQPHAASLTIGQTQQLTAMATYSDGTTKDVTSNATWSNDSGSVSVSSTGLVTAAAEGTATVSVRLDSVSDAATITVSSPGQ
jgi:uncharacterized protein YjdB